MMMMMMMINKESERAKLPCSSRDMAPLPAKVLNRPDATSTFTAG